jgi:splicing factor U2AF subunit
MFYEFSYLGKHCLFFIERSNRRSSRSRSRDRKSRRHRDRSREKESKRRRSRSPHENSRNKHSRSRSPKDRSKKENKSEKKPVKKYKYWDVPPVGFEHITPVQYKAMQGNQNTTFIFFCY